MYIKIVLIIVNINKDENKSLISNQFSLKNDFLPTSWRTILRGQIACGLFVLTRTKSLWAIRPDLDK
jgi:hypothetical protein